MALEHLMCGYAVDKLLNGPDVSCQCICHAICQCSVCNNNNNNNNNVTYIAQIRQGRKCATTCQCQTGMFSVESSQRDVTWPQVVWQRIPHDGTMNGETTVAVSNLSSCVDRRWSVAVCSWFAVAIQRKRASTEHLHRAVVAGHGSHYLSPHRHDTSTSVDPLYVPAAHRLRRHQRGFITRLSSLYVL